ncbi:MAG: pilin [Candidatus Wildermuthbacteria bacterium]|nr:pilin [Candidatus Wildermuthbacteria bacterium]
MKKAKKFLLSGTVLLFVLLWGIVPVVFAQGVGDPCSLEGEKSGNLVCQDGFWLFPVLDGPQSVGEIIQIIKNITNVVFMIFVAVSVIFIVLAGFLFVMEGKNPAKLEEARNKLIYAIVGIVLALLANAFPLLLQNLLGVGSPEQVAPSNCSDSERQRGLCE